MNKCLADLKALQSEGYREVMAEINGLASRCGLQTYHTYSRIWEYPWIWSRLEPFKARSLKVLDVGSQESPFPWFLATNGFLVTVSDVTIKYWAAWQKAARELCVDVRRCLLDAQKLNIATATMDFYMSISVIEHLRDKLSVISEAARVLRPGGYLIMTFDVCEPNMGMTFPEWNGRALTMAELDDLLRKCRWFEPRIWQMSWDVKEIADYLAWHRTTAPWHNYVTGAVMAQRTQDRWNEPLWKDALRSTAEKAYTSLHRIARWLRH